MSSIAPTETILRTPKKELINMFLNSQKIVYIAKALNTTKPNIFIYTDSLVALHCIIQDKNNL